MAIKVLQSTYSEVIEIKLSFCLCKILIKYHGGLSMSQKVHQLGAIAVLLLLSDYQSEHIMLSCIMSQ